MLTLALGAASSLLGMGNTAMQGVTNYMNMQNQKAMNEANIKAQKEINARNVAAQESINERNLEVQTALAQQQWERDDNAHQREVADLVAAGLSPLASTVGSSVTSAPYSPMIAPREDPLPEQKAYQMQAPQIDANMIMNSLLRSKEIDENARQFDEKMIREDKSLELTASNIALRCRELDIENNKVDAQLLQIANTYDLGVKQITQAKLELEQKKNELSFDNKKWIYKQLSDNNLLYAEQVGKAMSQGYMRVTPVTDWDTYTKLYEAYGKKLENFLASKGISRIGEISANFKAGDYGNGQGAGFGFGGSYKPNSKREEILWKQFQSENPLPLFIYGYVDWSKYPSLRFE